MKKVNYAVQLAALKAGRGMEREKALSSGTWIRPSQRMESKKTYNRQRQKQETRRCLKF